MDSANRSPDRWFMQPPSATSVVAVLEAVGILLLVVPLCAVVILLGPHTVRSWPALAVGAALALGAALLLLGDLRRLRAGAFSGFRPAVMVLELLSLTGVGACAAVAFGLRDGITVLATCVPGLAAPFIGGAAVIEVSWAATVAAVATETALQLPASTAVTTTLAFAGTVGLYGAALHRVLGHSVVTQEMTHALADVAASAGTLRRWPADLEEVAPRLAVILDVDRCTVATRPLAPVRAAPDPEPRLEVAFAWRSADDEQAHLELAARALDGATDVHDDRWWAIPASVGNAREVALVVPFRTPRGHPIDLAMARTVASLLGTMFERSRMVGGLVDLAFTDELTGLANRRRLVEALRGAVAAARRTGRPCSLAMVDLDHFKDHNDRFGHESGDDLLRRFARVLEATVAPTDLPARLGGDEFCVVMVGADQHSAASLMADVRAAWNASERTGGVTLSTGIATWPDHVIDDQVGGGPAPLPADPTDDAEAARQLLRYADMALYQAKASGRDHVTATGLPPNPRA